MIATITLNLDYNRIEQLLDCRFNSMVLSQQRWERPVLTFSSEDYGITQAMGLIKEVLGDDSIRRFDITGVDDDDES